MIEADSQAEIGQILARTQAHWIETNKRTLEVLTYDPKPQTGCTPKEIIWRKNKSKLYRYQASTGRRYKTPILLLYALINKPYILDLSPGYSLIEYLVAEGYDVYLLDWGEFEWEDRNLSFADFVHDYVAPSVKRVARKAESAEVSLIGYCMGGTIATLYAGIYENPVIRNIVYLAAPIDFSDAGNYTVWLKAPGFDPDRIVDTLQHIPKDYLNWGTKMLNPVSNYLGHYSRLWFNIEEGKSIQFWKVLNKWMTDGISFPGAAYRDWIKEFYQENRLIKNQVVLRGKKVHLQRIKSNLLALVGKKDHISLPHQTRAALNYLGGEDKTYLEFPVGHGGLALGTTAREKIFPTISNWLKDRSEIWVEPEEKS
jgi:polyhydroxyalkanoate synthase